MSDFPKAFVARMNKFLGKEAPAFWESLRSGTPNRGLRVNTLKIPVADFKSRMDVDLVDLAWSEVGFRAERGQLGRHPYHAAGLYYLQEPSAIAVSEILDPQPGERILDIAAAPGGKSTHLASLMDDDGLLVTNDPHGGRVQALARNLERIGTRNTLITQEVPERLAERWGPIFDRVLVDAPCSGEGMFRVHPEEKRSWSTNFIQRCADRQNEILWFAARLVRPGGMLCYATCTFAPEENEGSVKRFLQGRPDYTVVPVPHRPGFSPGQPSWVDGPASLANTVRIWPHHGPGEGHFIALLKKSDGDGEKREGAAHKPISQAKRKMYRDFVERRLQTDALPQKASPSYPYMAQHDEKLYALTELTPPLAGLRVRQAGWRLGSTGKGQFVPSHALAMGLSGDCFRDPLELTHRDPEVVRYLRGLPIQSSGEEGWTAVTVDGYPLGWGKRKGDRVHSHAPRWLSHI